MYTIKNVINGRGTLVAVEGQTNVGATDITLSGYESKSETAMTDGDKWYVSTVDDNVFLYNIANGKFLNNRQGDPVQFTDTPVKGTILTPKDDYYVISNGSFKVSCCPGYDKGQTVRWLSNDEADSQHLTFTLVEGGTFDSQIAAADEAIATAMSPKTQLQELIDLVKTYESGTNIGDYTEDAIKGLKEAIDAAKAKIEADNVTDDDVETLQAVIDALAINLPETGKYYRFISAATTQSRGTNVVMVANRTSGKVEWKAYGEDGNINAEIDNLWKFVDNGSGKYYLMAANGGYVGSVAGGSAKTVLQTDVNNAGAYTLDFYTPGICKLFHGNAAATHLWADGNNIICGWEDGAASNSAWYIVPATNIDVVVNEYASIYLPFAVKVEGAQAYAIESTNATRAFLTEKADIPAGQGAILAGNGSATLNIVADASSDWTNNKLNGSNVNTYVEGLAYVLANSTEGVGLYKAKLNKDGNGAEGTTHFLNNTNKAYLPVGASGARFLSFDFGTETAIENVKSVENNAAVYDLAGRRVQGAQKGIYVVNGKVVIK
ncbi:MAG: FIVAR domain-containing protein [Bacteroidaceae bacterium]|nr:FIVAR domain-containing protein [Bacteroidaceae bacterium]